jgi:hypothetical protein
MNRVQPFLLLVLAVGCSKSSSAPEVAPAPPPHVPQPAPPPRPKNVWDDLKDPVDGILYKITKAAIVQAANGQAVEVEYEQVAKLTASCKVVIKVGNDITTYQVERIMFSLKGAPIRFIPAGTFVRGIRDKVEVWIEKDAGTVGDPANLASAKLEAKREKAED